MQAFRHLPVLSLEDVTHNFEQLQSEGALGSGEGDGAASASAVLGGISSAEWAGASHFSGHVTVTVPRAIRSVVLQSIKPVSGTPDSVAILEANPEGNTTFKFYLMTPLTEPAAKTVGLIMWVAWVA
jgi:hypothetical protein